MNDAQRQAADEALEAWVKPLLAESSVFTRNAYQSFFDSHKDALIEVIGGAVLSVPNA